MATQQETTGARRQRRRTTSGQLGEGQDFSHLDQLAAAYWPKLVDAVRPR